MKGFQVRAAVVSVVLGSLVGASRPSLARWNTLSRTLRSSQSSQSSERNERARAERSRSEAGKAAQARGVVALNLGRPEEAVRELEAAYALIQDPNILFSLAQAHRLADQPARALAACAAYLRATGGGGKNRVQVERLINELQAIVDRMTSPDGDGKAPRPAPVQVSDAELDALMMSSLHALPGGEKAEMEGGATEDPDGGAAEPLAKEPAVAVPKLPPAGVTPPPFVALAPLPAPRPEERKHLVYERWWFWAGVAGALGLGATGAYLTWLGNKSEADPPATSLGAQRVF